MNMLEARNVSVRYGALKVLDGASFTLNAGEWLMLAGPNGAGKSTLLGALSGGAPYTGEVLLHGESLRSLKPARLARQMGVLSQSHSVGYPFTVEEVVALGRYAHSRGMLRARSDEDAEKIESALALTGMDEKRGQSVLTLSGGELQRVFLAQVLAQDPRILLLDEPANHLDLPYQKRVFELVSQWLEQPGRAVLSVVHDLSLARAFATRALLMNHGRIVAQGEPAGVLSGETLNAVYGMDVCGWMRSLLSQWAM